MDNNINKRPLIIFDFQGTLVKRMRPPVLNGTASRIKKLSRYNTLAIFTGASKTETLNILRKLQIYTFFDPKNIITKGLFPGKPNPLAVKWLIKKNQPTRTMFVGDTPKDFLTAKNASIDFILVGNRNLDTTQIRSVDDLLNVKINL